MPGPRSAVSDASPGQTNTAPGGNLQVPTPESPLWFPQVARSGQQGHASTLPKFLPDSGSRQSGTADTGLYSTDTLPALDRFELPLLKAQQVQVPHSKEAHAKMLT